jgi:DNA-binding transcriptional LysR family regulator
MSGPLQDSIADFAIAHPEVKLQVHVSSRMVDLQREGYDVAIRATGELEPGLVARTLAKTALVGVASPNYPQPKTLAELRKHRCLMGFSRGELPQTHWTIAGRKLHLEGAAFSNNPAWLCRLAERGYGIAFVPESIAADALSRGALVAVLPKLLRAEGSISIVYVDRELMPPQVRAFVDWMIARRDALRPLRRRRAG